MQFLPIVGHETAKSSARSLIEYSPVVCIRVNSFCCFSVSFGCSPRSFPLARAMAIAPHALAFNGFRWHARAWCEVDECFKDFVLSRMLGTRAIKAGSVDEATDADLSKITALEIGPQPELSPPQRAAIALDYGMSDGRLTIHVRRAMLYFALKRLGLDTDPSARRPQDRQIALLSRGTGVTGARFAEIEVLVVWKLILVVRLNATSALPKPKWCAAPLLVATTGGT